MRAAGRALASRSVARAATRALAKRPSIPAWLSRRRDSVRTRARPDVELVGGDREPASRGAGGRLRFWHLAAHGRARAEPACLRVTATGEEPRVGSRPSASRRAARRPRATSTRDSRDRSRGGDAAEEQQIPRGDAVPPHEKVARADILGGKDDESRVRSRASAAARATATARTLALAPTRRASLPRARRTDSNR